MVRVRQETKRKGFKMTKIHVRNWTGTGSVRVIDMTNAGKRGKRCEAIHYQGQRWGRLQSQMSEAEKASEKGSLAIEFYVARLAGKTPNDSINMVIDADYAEVAGTIKAMVAEARAAGAETWAINAYDEVIRGVDAPVAPLSASSAKVSVSADESGISIRDLVDANNWPAMISIRQSEQQAYRYAAKVWPAVVEAVAQGAGMYAIGDILSNAGCNLHSYCMMD